MATAYDFWKACAGDAAEPEPPTELVAAKLTDWLDDHDSVAEALDDLAANSDHGSSGRYTLFSADLARVLTADPATFEVKAARYFVDLREQLRLHLKDAAEAQVLVDIEDANEGATEAANECRASSADWLADRLQGMQS